MTPGTVPLDHGYLLYSALSGQVPGLHEASWLAIHPLVGRKIGNETLFLANGSQVTLRLPSRHVLTALALANRSIRIGVEPFQLGQPTIRALEPSRSLFSWQVAIRLTKTPHQPDGKLDIEAFQSAVEAEAKRQLTALGIDATITVVAKRIIHVKGQRIVAFSMEVGDLSDDDSIKLQSAGIGGKHRLGCGVFRPSHRRDTDH